MAFIDRIVGPDEKLIGIVSVHWIYGLKGLLWFTGFMLLGLFLDYHAEKLLFTHEDYAGLKALNILSNYAFWTATLIGALLFMFYVIMMLATELGLTDKRVIYKRGLLLVDVRESDLEEIKAAEVDNGVLGRILNYGYINFDARFVENVQLPAIDDPYRFVKAMNEARSELKEDSMTIVLDGVGSAHNKRIKQVEGKEDIEHEPHTIDQERYRALESNPVKATGSVIEDTQGEVKQSVDKLDKDLKAMGGTDIKHAKPKKSRSESNPETSSSLKTSKPILFKRDIKKRKAYLQKKIMNAFSRKTKKPRENT